MKTNGNNQLQKGREDYRCSKAVLVILILLLGMFSGSSAFGAYWFLGIGNDGYIRDVDGLYNTLMSTHNWQETPVYSRIISDHGGSQILDDLAWLGNAQPGDLAVFYYSGHGGFLSDYSGEELAGWAMDSFDETIGYTYDQCRDDQISNALNIVNPAVSLVTIFDSCYSGGMVGGLDDLNALPNVYALLSSREDQPSYGDYPYSVFTTHLINGVSGMITADNNNNGFVTLDEWFGYAAANTIGQTPVNFDASDLGSIPIISIPEPATMVILLTGAYVVFGKHRVRGI